MLSAILLLLVYLLWIGDVLFFGPGTASIHYRWVATAAMISLFVVLLRPHGNRWWSADSRLNRIVASKLPTFVARLLRSRGAIAILFFAITTLGVAGFLREMSRGHPDITFVDMLPLIRRAVPIFLAGGDPYRTYFLPWEIHFNYYPALWLPYIVAAVAGIDYRWIGIAAEAGIMVVWWKLADGRARQAVAPTIGGPIFALQAALMAALFLLNARHRWFGAQLHVVTWWFYLALFCWSATRRHAQAASLAMGLCCASSVAAFFILPFWLMFAWRSDRQMYWRLVSLTIAPVVLLFTPFILWNAREFLWGFARWYQITGEAAWKPIPAEVFETFGITAPLFAAGLVRWMPAIQIVGLAVLLGLAWVRLRDTVDLLRFTTAALTWFSMTALLPADFLYLPCLMLLSFTLMLDANINDEYAKAANLPRWRLM